MKKNIKYIILLGIIAVLVFFLIFKFYPFKLNKRYSFHLNNFTRPKMTIVKTDMKKASIEQKAYKPIECTITNKKYIEKIFNNILNNRAVPTFKEHLTPLLYTNYSYMISIQGVKNNERLNILYLDNRYIVILSPTKGLKRYKFNSKDINLEFIDKIIN